MLTDEQHELIEKVAATVKDTQPVWSEALTAMLDEVKAAEYAIRTHNADVRIGQLVRAKLHSLNNVPVERCTVTAAEMRDIDDEIVGRKRRD